MTQRRGGNNEILIPNFRINQALSDIALDSQWKFVSSIKMKLFSKRKEEIIPTDFNMEEESSADGVTYLKGSDHSSQRKLQTKG